MGWLVWLYAGVAIFLQWRTHRRGLLWVSYMAALLGGCTLAYYTAIGHKIGTISHGVAVVATVIGAIALLCDLADRKPEKLAVGITLVLPSLALGVGGWVGSSLHTVFGFVASFGGTLGGSGLGV